MKTHLLKALLPCAVLSVMLSNAQTPQRYSRIALNDPDAAVKSTLHNSGLDPGCGVQRRLHDGVHTVQFECSQNELSSLRAQGLEPTVIVEDIGAYYAQRSASNLAQAKSALALMKAQGSGRRGGSGYCTSPEYPVPSHFILGDMGGFLYYDQILDMLDTMAVEYPQLVTVKRPLSDSLTTIRGRQVYWVKISDNPTADEDEPEVLYTALTHAREPASAMSLLYYMWYLLENYDTDPEIKRIVDMAELYFVPVVNPDGYVYNSEMAPEGGGMWRKNLHDNDANGIIDDNDGVDLNRNYGYLWGLDDFGSSPKPKFSTYRGTAPFSEPETCMLRDFVFSRSFVSAMHDHSYGTDLYYSWDHGEEVLPDSSAFYRLSDLMSWDNRYHFGESYKTYWLGAINGGANDWFYGEQSEKSKIFSWIPEIGDAFWPDPLDIVSMCQDQMGPHLMLAKTAIPNAKIHDLNPPGITYGVNQLVFRIENLGQYSTDLKPVIIPIGKPAADFSQQSDVHLSLDGILNTAEIVVNIDVLPQAPDGSDIEFELVLEALDYPVVKSRIVKTINPVVALEYHPVLLDLGVWDSKSWGTVPDLLEPNTICITDSPGSLQHNALNTLTLKEGIDLSDISWAKMSFKARWSIETQHDFVQIQARTGNTPWHPLCGRYSKPGATGYDVEIPSSYAGQPTGEPVYDGRQLTWICEEVDVSDFVGMQDVQVRFVAWSGALVSPIEEDGFYFTDFKVLTSRKLHCANHVQDAGEEDVDCGGPDCAPCATCSDGIQNGDEMAVDCGGEFCEPCASCNDGIQNSDEEGIDCGGSTCAPCATCTDGIMNGDEEGIDCGGALCALCPTCTDGIQNGDETGTDCGGAFCVPCVPTCNDGIMNGNELGVDCGGDCLPCRTRCCEYDSRFWNSDSELRVSVTPNPAQRRLMINATWQNEREYPSQDILIWQILDFTGTTLNHGEFRADSEVSVDVSKLVAQMYLLRVADPRGNVTVQRFLKQD